MSPSQYISCSQVPFDKSDSAGELVFLLSEAQWASFQALQFMKPTQSLAEVQHLCYLMLKTKHRKHQLWHNHQQQVHRKQFEVPSPLHREKLEHLRILFHNDRDTWLCVPQNLVARNSLNTSLMSYLAPFKEKKKKSTDTFPPSKSQEKHDKICRGGSLSENTPGNMDNQEYFPRELFWRVSRDKSLLWMIISNQNSCQLKTIQSFPSVCSHCLEGRLPNSPQKGPQCSCFAKQICFCRTKLLSNADLIKGTRSRFRLALASPSSIC